MPGQDSEHPECPLSKAALLLSSKWDLIVIHYLLEGALRFSELREKISSGLPKPVTASSLSRILKRLELNGIVKKNIRNELGESVEIKYELTEKGKALKSVILDLYKWGETYLE